MTTFSLRMSRSANGVSRRHGAVAREMWRGLWPERAVEAVPITHVTNGVHMPSWVGAPMRRLLDRHLGDEWLWRGERRRDLGGARRWCRTPSCGRPGASSARSWWSSSRSAAGSTGSPSASRARGSRRPPARLTRTCSRSGSRGAPRPTSGIGLLTHDPDRTLALLAGPQPVQFVLAGKAHPSDEEAKRVVQEMFRFKDAPHVAEHVVYLHDYDLGMAARLVRGCDLWLNLPRPPMEASGTSGMKAVINGGLNLSVLDGWWAEAYDGTNGWALAGEVDPDHAAQDARDAAALYDLLEQEVLPAFYDRDADGLPRSWLARIRASMRTLAPAFCAGRMLDDYLDRVYAPTRTSA